MPSTYTTNLGIEKIGTGEQSGTWGGTLNTNWDLFDEAVSGQVTVTLAATGSTGSPNDLPVTDGVSSTGRHIYVEFDDGGDLGGDAYVQLTPNDAEKLTVMKNSLSASRNLIVFQGTYNAGRAYTIPNGAVVYLKFDGQGASASTVVSVLDNLRTSSITLDNTGRINWRNAADSGSWYFTLDGSDDLRFIDSGGTTQLQFDSDQSLWSLITNSFYCENLDAAGDIAAVGTVTGSNLSGTNTGDQTITLTGQVTGSGTGSFAASLGNSAISGQTALTTGLLSTDELLVSDGGVIKRMDVSVLETLLQSDLLHNSFSDYDADQHIDWTSTSSNLQTSGSITGGSVTASSADINGTLDAQIIELDTSQIIRTNNNTGVLNLHGDVSMTSGGFMKLYGNSHATKADYIEVGKDNTPLWTITQFTSTVSNQLLLDNGLVIGDDTALSAIQRESDDGVVMIFGGAGGSSGGIALYGGTHATKAYDIELGNNLFVTELQFDYSNNAWDFKSNSIFMTEKASAETDVANSGQIWVQTGTPCKLMFTDDAGTDHEVAFV